MYKEIHMYIVIKKITCNTSEIWYRLRRAHTVLRRPKAEERITQRRYLVAIEPCNVTEAAKTLGLSPQTTRAWVSQKRIRHYRMGRKIVFNKRDLETLIENNVVEIIDPREIEIVA